jgi:tripeptide aminopeptidase
MLKTKINEEVGTMDVNQQRLVDEFLELVKIDSASKDERLMADALMAKLEALGFSVSEDDTAAKIGGTAGNVIGILEGEKDAPPLLFCAHMDRVHPGLGIKPQIKDGVITSDGTTILAADDIAGVVAILEAIRIIQEKKLPHGRLEILFTVAEEGGLYGAKSVDATQFQAQAGFFMDAGGPVGTIVTAAPAQKGLKATIHGKAAHAGVAPEDGISAIVIAAEAITKMKLGRIDPETTANIGVIQGGAATNIIPDKVELRGEARSRNNDKLDQQMDSMVAALNAASARHGVKADISVDHSYSAFGLTESDYPVQLGVKAAEAIGLQPSIESTGGGSDANIINGYGIPSLVLGMGYTDVHTTAESISVEQLLVAAKYVLSIIATS